MTPVDAAPALYAEPARGYRSVLISGLGVAAAFGLDLLLAGPAGARAHLPGWIAVAVIIVGVHMLFIAAARSTRSLVLTADELRVGDEALSRAEIVGVTHGTDPELPALGWPQGMRRGIGGVTVRLYDDQDVVVPTRFPDRLEAALGVGRAEPASRDEVRPAEPDDLALIPEIDERSEVIFRVAGYELPVIEVDERVLDAAAAVFVVGTPVVGYVRIDDVDGTAHVGELAVLPGAMRRGHGSRLLERACAWAVEHGYASITLITYRDVAWNAPFYAARGFVETPLTPGLATLRAHETELGLDAVGPRIAMRREL